jgi:hypothetical protein
MCRGYHAWNGFSAKFLQIQMDAAPSALIADQGAIWIDPPAATIEGGPMDSNTSTYVWREVIDHVLARALRVNATQPGIIPGAGPANGVIPSSTRVCSYAVHGDRFDDNGALQGRLQLPGQRVLGIVTTSAAMAATAELAAPSTRYARQGLERSDSIDWRQGADGAVLTWSLRFGGGVDTFRVVTDCGQ